MTEDISIQIKNAKAITVLFSLLAAYFLICGIIFIVGSIYIMTTYEKAPGKVIDLIDTSAPNKTPEFATKVSFSTAAGEKVVFIDKITAPKSMIKTLLPQIGDKVIVYYNGIKLTHALIFTKRMIYIILMNIGIGSAILYLIISIWHGIKKRELSASTLGCAAASSRSTVGLFLRSCRAAACCDSTRLARLSRSKHQLYGCYKDLKQ